MDKITIASTCLALCAVMHNKPASLQFLLEFNFAVFSLLSKFASSLFCCSILTFVLMYTTECINLLLLLSSCVILHDMS